MHGGEARKLPDKFHADIAASLSNGACEKRWVRMRIFSTKKYALFIAALLLVNGWAQPGNAAPEKLVLTGASTIAPLAAEIARRFESQHPGTRIDVQTGGSSRGINDTRNGTAEIGMVSRALKPAEQDLQAHTIALDGVGLILHASNPSPG